jgi:hypothetical protein
MVGPVSRNSNVASQASLDYYLLCCTWCIADPENCSDRRPKGQKHSGKPHVPIARSLGAPYRCILARLTTLSTGCILVSQVGHQPSLYACRATSIRRLGMKLQLPALCRGSTLTERTGLLVCSSAH